MQRTPGMVSRGGAVGVGLAALVADGGVAGYGVGRPAVACGCSTLQPAGESPADAWLLPGTWPLLPAACSCSCLCWGSCGCSAAPAASWNTRSSCEMWWRCARESGVLPAMFGAVALPPAVSRAAAASRYCCAFSAFHPAVRRCRGVSPTTLRTPAREGGAWESPGVQGQVPQSRQ